MDAGQITQGLRADILSQQGQDSSMSQTGENGISFADIMLMIAGNQQNGQQIPGVQSMPQMVQMPDMQLAAQNGEMTEMPEMQFIPQNGIMPEMQTVPQSEKIPEVPEMQTMPQSEKMPENPEMQTVPQNEKMPEVPEMQTVPQSEKMPEVPEMQTVPQSEKMPEVPEMQTVPQNEKMPEVPEMQTVPQNDKMPEVPEMQTVPQNEKMPEVPEKQFVPQSKNNLEISEILIQTELNNNPKQQLSADKSQDNSRSFEIPVMQNENDSLSGNAAEKQNLQTVVDVTDNTAEKLQNAGGMPDSVQNHEAFRQYGEQLIIPDTDVADRQNSETLQQQESSEYTENVFDAPEKLPVEKNERDLFGMPFMYSRESEKAVFTDNPLNKQFEDIFSVLSPKLDSYSSEGRSKDFTMDLMSGLNEENKVKDSFDFSENVIKADPFQLAGLLDFVGTGMGIPAAADLNGSEILKNIRSDGSLNADTERLVFDPEEMIKSGEMEIVSYVPADKKAQSGMSQENMSQSQGKTIDFARTMKSVRDNVKPKYSDEEEFVNKISQMTMEDMERHAEKIDISFDRAYAELEMNKAKYGSADEQLFKGISENLKKGRSEFTVKLRPEGLGEILVKLVSEEGGKTVLSMVASSAKTAALLNRDLAALQTSLNQHDVEIENNSVRTTETVMAASSSFSQYDQKRQDEGRQQNQFRELRKKIGSISSVNPSFEGEAEVQTKPDLNPALNITI